MAQAIEQVRSYSGSAPFARSGLRVLLVDPDPPRRAKLRRWLAGRHEIHLAPNAEDAIGAAREIIPSVLAIDAGTPNAICLVDQILESLAVFEIGVMLTMDAGAEVPAAWSDYVVLRRPFTRGSCCIAWMWRRARIWPPLPCSGASANAARKPKRCWT